MKKLLLLLLCLLVCRLVVADISLSVSSGPIVVDESFQLIFKSDEKIDGEPDFTPLNELFTVLNRSTQSHTQIINGKISHLQQWVLSVLPKKTGMIEIPTIHFGDQMSQPRMINIITHAPSTNDSKEDLFLEVKIDTAGPYVQAQVIYTVKLYRSIPTSNPILSNPTIKGSQAIIDRLGDDKNYEEQLNGKHYIVTERNFVIFPQNSGLLTIEPVIFKAQTKTNHFFNLDLFQSQSKTIVKRSDAITLNVKPIPDSFIGKTWLPAENLIVQEQWSALPNKLKQGEAVTRTLVLRARGLAASNLPAIDDVLPDSFKKYPEQAKFEEDNDRDGFVGTRKEKMAIIATQGGDYTLPGIKIPWWNTKTDRIEYAELPARYLHVETAMIPSQNNTFQDQVLPITESEQNTIQYDPMIIKTTTSSFWKWMSLVMCLLWLFTIIALWLKQTKKKEIVEEENRLSARQTLKQLESACHENDPVKAKQMLLNWATLQWPDDSINSIEQIKKYAHPELNIKLDKLHSVLYGKNNSQWDGQAFLMCFKAQSFKTAIHKCPTGKLLPLYKI